VSLSVHQGQILKGRPGCNFLSVTFAKASITNKCNLLAGTLFRILAQSASRLATPPVGSGGDVWRRSRKFLCPKNAIVLRQQHKEW